jgi:hypothetical protein
VLVYTIGEPDEYDALVQGDSRHYRERAAPRATGRSHRGRFSDRSCRQQVTLQTNNPLVIYLTCSCPEIVKDREMVVPFLFMEHMCFV